MSLPPKFGSQAHKAGHCDRCGKAFMLTETYKDIVDPHWTYDNKLMCEPCCEALVKEQVASYI